MVNRNLEILFDPLWRDCHCDITFSLQTSNEIRNFLGREAPLTVTEWSGRSILTIICRSRPSHQSSLWRVDSKNSPGREDRQLAEAHRPCRCTDTRDTEPTRRTAPLAPIPAAAAASFSFFSTNT